MKTWTVQCTYAAYYSNTVVVKAPTLEAALETAIETANSDLGWRSLDDCGPTFVDAVAKGDVWDPFDGLQSSLPVPARFAERGEPPAVIVIVRGGAVEHVRVENGKAHVEVRDYDLDGADPDDPAITTDENDARHARTLWPEFPPRADQPR